MLRKNQSRACTVLIFSFTIALTLSLTDSLSAAESEATIRANNKKSCIQAYVKDASYTEKMNEVYCDCLADTVWGTTFGRSLTEEFWTKDFDDLVNKNTRLEKMIDLCDTALRQRFTDHQFPVNKKKEDQRLTDALAAAESERAAESARTIHVNNKKSCAQFYARDASYTAEMNEAYCNCLVEWMHGAGVQGPIAGEKGLFTEEFWTKDFDALEKKHTGVSMSVSMCDSQLKRKFPDHKFPVSLQKK